MKREEFIQNLEGIVTPLIKCTEDLCWNNLSDNIRYTIKPNQSEESEHLDEFELKLLKHRNKEIKRVYTISQIADRLVNNEKVPVWINVSVYKAEKKWTIVELLISRRMRREYNELYHKIGFPPFHISIPLPPFRTEDQKFDVNWKHKKWKLRYKAFFWKYRNRSKPNHFLNK